MRTIKNIAKSVALVVIMMATGCMADPEFENTVSDDNDALLTKAQSEERYYYSFDKKIYIREVPDKVVVTYAKEQRSSVEENLSQSGRIPKDNYQILGSYSNDYLVIATNNDSRKGATEEELSKFSGVKSVRPMIAIDGGPEIGYSNEIVLQFKDGASPKEIDGMNKTFGLEIVQATKHTYVLSVPVEFEPIDVANAYQESGLVNFSNPRFFSKVELFQTLPTDSYFNNQFYLRNTGQSVNGRTSTTGADINVTKAWSITKGNSDIVVAVLDFGVTSNHPDLPNSRQVRLSGSNFEDPDGNPNVNANDPSPTWTGTPNPSISHGNACAGIIAASHNNGGIAGIAPNCKIMPIRIFDSGGDIVYLDRLGAAIRFAADEGADIISNSWGFENKVSDWSSDIVSAISYATTTGRGGKGSVVIFAASNSAKHHLGNDSGEIAFPANVKIDGVLSVGATDRNDRQTNYSPTSNLSSSENQIIDVVAPSHSAYSTAFPTETGNVWTMDIPGVDGYNPTKIEQDAWYYYGENTVYLPSSGTDYQAYTGHFGGTSAAAPMVAGVAALVLSLYPNLTQKQVADLIEQSARKIPYYHYGNSTSRPNGQWNTRIGYGVVDAFQAVMGNATITGNDTSWLNAGSTYSVSAPLAGATFVNWTASPSSGYAVTGGTTSRTLNIRFTSPGTYTLKANFRMPNNVMASAEKTVVAKLEPPIITGDPEVLPYYPGYPNGSVRWVQYWPGHTPLPYFYVGSNYDTSARYEWRTQGVIFETDSGVVNVDTTGMSHGHPTPLECRAYKNGVYSEWSTVYMIISQSRPVGYAPAPAPLAPEAEEGTVGTDE